MNITLAYKLGAVTNVATVIRSGIVAFIDCIFMSGSDNPKYPNYASVYIADVVNDAKLLLKGCRIWNIQVDGNVLIHAFHSSEIEIQVCRTKLFLIFSISLKFVIYFNTFTFRKANLYH
jgi:hypothetical protein